MDSAASESFWVFLSDFLVFFLSFFLVFGFSHWVFFWTFLIWEANGKYLDLFFLQETKRKPLYHLYPSIEDLELPMDHRPPVLGVLAHALQPGILVHDENRSCRSLRLPMFEWWVFAFDRIACTGVIPNVSSASERHGGTLMAKQAKNTAELLVPHSMSLTQPTHRCSTSMCFKKTAGLSFDKTLVSASSRWKTLRRVTPSDGPKLYLQGFCLVPSKLPQIGQKLSKTPHLWQCWSPSRSMGRLADALRSAVVHYASSYPTD